MVLGCCLTFGKRKENTRLWLVSFTLSESLATSRVHESRYPARKTIWYHTWQYLDADNLASGPRMDEKKLAPKTA